MRRVRRGGDRAGGATTAVGGVGAGRGSPAQSAGSGRSPVPGIVALCDAGPGRTSTRESSRAARDHGGKGRSLTRTSAGSSTTRTVDAGGHCPAQTNWHAPGDDLGLPGRQGTSTSRSRSRTTLWGRTARWWRRRPASTAAWSRSATQNRSSTLLRRAFDRLRGRASSGPLRFCPHAGVSGPRTGIGSVDTRPRRPPATGGLRPLVRPGNPGSR